MAGAQDVNHVGKLKIGVGKKHQQVVDQVGSLVLQLLLVVHRGGQRRLDAFLAHLLRNALRASCIEACGVGRGRIGGAAALKQHFELAQEVPLVLDGRKAALRAAVAGRAFGVDEHEKRFAVAVGADVDGVCRGLASFQPLEHRVEPCGEIDGVRYVNDSKATNTDAVEKALTAFPDDDVILLLGGHDKGTPLTDFARVVMDNVRSVVCFGDARERFTAAMDEADVDGDVDIAQADDLRDAVDVARSLSSRGDVILLSPACSSFDEFSGYEERGRVFKDYVAQLAAAAKSQME